MEFVEPLVQGMQNIYRTQKTVAHNTFSNINNPKKETLIRIILRGDPELGRTIAGNVKKVVEPKKLIMKETPLERNDYGETEFDNI